MINGQLSNTAARELRFVMLKRLSIIPVVLGGVLLFLAGCAGSQYGLGKSLLEAAQYDQAIVAFTMEVETNPENQRAWRDMGVAYFKQGDDAGALEALNRAYELDGEDGVTIFYLGAIHEQREDYPRAISYYRQYTAITRLSKMRRQMEGRLEWLTRKQMEAEAKQAIANEKTIDVASIPENTIAVLYFRNLGQNRGLDPLQKGIADMIITDLSKVQGLQVIERVRMQKLMEEMGLGSTGLVDIKTAPRIGRLLGASTLVNGTFIDLDESTMRLDAGVIVTRTGELELSREVVGELEQIFRMEKELVFNLVDRLGITLTDDERESILLIPTESLLAFVTYSEGLSLEDLGDFEGAQSSYEAALSIDPGFDLAGTRMQQTAGLQQGSAAISQVEGAVAQEAAAEGEKVKGRLGTSGENVGAGFVPGKDAREPVQEEAGSTIFTGGVPVEIEIVIPEL